MPGLVRLYSIVSNYALVWFLPLVVWWRVRHGSEDHELYPERYGREVRSNAATHSPDGTLWIHAAGPGEALSALVLVEQISLNLPHLQILLTSHERSATKLLEDRLSSEVACRYAPYDIEKYYDRLITRWNVTALLVVEAELWPNMIVTAKRRGLILGLVNARMSPASAKAWRKISSSIRYLYAQFDFVFAQDKTHQARIAQFMERKAVVAGNLKLLSPPPTVDTAVRAQLSATLGERKFWLAASTHASEEMQVLEVHSRLRKKHPDLGLILVPRHPARASEVRQIIDSHGFGTQLRSEDPSRNWVEDVYLVDTLGELGMFYAMAGIVFLGGSFVDRGGHNPVEPAREACSIITGPSNFNFADIVSSMEAAGAISVVNSGEELEEKVDGLLNSSELAISQGNRSKEWLCEQSSDVLAAIVMELSTRLNRKT